MGPLRPWYDASATSLSSLQNQGRRRTSPRYGRRSHERRPLPPCVLYHMRDFSFSCQQVGGEYEILSRLTKKTRCGHASSSSVELLRRSHSATGLASNAYYDVRRRLP